MEPGKSDLLRAGDLYTDRNGGPTKAKEWPEYIENTLPFLRGPNPQAILIARKDQIPRVMSEKLAEIEALRAELKATKGALATAENNLEQANESRDSWKKAHQENFTELFAYRMKYPKAIQKFKVGETYRLGDLPVGARIEKTNPYLPGSKPSQRTIAAHKKAGEHSTLLGADFPYHVDSTEFTTETYIESSREVTLVELPTVKVEKKEVQAMGAGDGYTFPQAPAAPSPFFVFDWKAPFETGFDIRTPEQKISDLTKRVGKLEADLALTKLDVQLGPTPARVAEVARDEVVKALKSSVIEVTVKDDEK